MSGSLHLAAARCHAVRVRSDRSPGPAEPPGLWTEDVPVPAAHPLAERRRHAELARPAEAPRKVLLRYADGPCDLIVVAPRDRWNRTALGLLAAGEAVVPGTAEAPSGAPTVAPPPAWGLGDDGPTVPHLFSLTDGGDEATWLAALAVTLRRYDPESTPVIGTDHGSFTVEQAPTLGELKPSPADRPAFAGLLFDEAEVPGAYVPCLAPPFPLTLSVFRDADGWRLRCDHVGAYVSTEMAVQFTRHLVRAHQHILSAPRTAVDDVDPLDEAERERVAALGRPAHPLVSTPTGVSEAFARIADATPNRIAVTDGAADLTYRELDDRAALLAQGLRAHGVGPGDRVGVCLERTAELVIALLAVLKAGAAYVPVDPAYPADRVAHTARDAGTGVVITRLPDFPDVPGCAPLTPDDLLDAAAAAAAAAGAGAAGATGSGDAAPLPRVAPDAAAYVIYTSGSTGRPKGVEVPHRSVIALIDATRDEYGFGAEDVWTWFHSSAFDFSVWEIWGCLLTGGRLVVVPYFLSREPDGFRDLLVSEKVTVLSQTPSAFAQLLDVDHSQVGVRLVVFGGEPLDARMLLPWFDRHPESACRLVNMFGITETTVHVTHQTLTRHLALTATRSVGPALPGWHLYVTDEAGRLLPPGVAGEICVGGAGVALGYLGQEELTARRFVADPFTGGTMYRSGDLGRLRPDGRLEHLGRIDSQVKIRGFRIELDEIRAVLLEDPDVRSAAVVVHRDDPADAATARIDAYVVLTGGTPATVRNRAAGLLPDYMLPTTVTPLESLPLTANGKLDTTRLPAPTSTPPEVPAPGTEPATSSTDDDLTGHLREIWSDVLGRPVGLDDDFFELGGNSLFAVRIGAALRARGLPSLRLRELYRHPTIRETAEGLASSSG
ncbi:non-ribosomal peptide synthetase [Streptomyces stelliscabiei]|uniref:non-ribosomal peptide synthetase n=1 Tax=Streptomyces stelliscabiei TaxID=146820 RepID=UPI0029A6E555|nr:amino acid adenylation domain-containing protein [Streptomyces stelliscabiei]MDX2556067.1 amino acid adenylation domain-containing protein [Streptomyces stelliscabiei]MDX2617759.1 amino acid adenylation domain-containing protein [Streptomyces stelliscabiei]MDX2640132.1 amino acid adenylation domain-containing protein [Streptomyces stelliscabiei]MDX2667694.1 amino acid adenylation domain-containing protein [Streptomyces stelliscabiei]MDX2718506.1 amino acid adenylation domain-containing prot